MKTTAELLEALAVKQKSLETIAEKVLDIWCENCLGWYTIVGDEVTLSDPQQDETYPLEEGVMVALEAIQIWLDERK